MGSYNSELNQMVGVDDVETFIDDLYQYGPFPSLDPEEEGTEPWTFYDMGGQDLPYTMQAVLEYYFNHKRAVKITIEDAGPARGPRIAAEGARQAQYRREQALIALEAEARHRARTTHRPKY